jgi:hypothetical protein
LRATSAALHSQRQATASDVRLVRTQCATDRHVHRSVQ